MIFYYLFFLFPIVIQGLQTQYFIAIEKNQGQYIKEPSDLLLPSSGKFYADPFLFTYNGIDYLFFEDCDYQKGQISYVVVEEGKIKTAPRVALKTRGHLSFPLLFEDKGTIYLLPETYASQEVALYRSVHFPERWVKDRVLLGGDRFSDPILFQHGGYYWLFVAVKKDRLRIYYATDLEAPFFPHPVNQLDIEGRNAGGVFWKEGKLIRPTMDCRLRYGRAIVFKEILILTTTEFEEREVGYIEPDWAPNLVGTHGYSMTDHHIAYDGERLKEKPKAK